MSAIHSTRCWIAATCLAGLLLGFWITADGAPRRRNRGRGSEAAAKALKRVGAAAEAQVAAGKQLLAAAEGKGARAQADYGVALNRMREAVAEFEAAQQEVRDLAKQLAEIEQEIIAEQSADSPYAQALAEFEKAKRDLQALETMILSRPEVQARLAALTGIDVVTERASELDRHPERLTARSRVELAAKVLDQIRRELYHADQDWTDTADALTEARAEKKEAEEDTHSVSRLGPLHDFKNAQQAAAYAKRAIAQGEATLKQVSKAKSKAANKPGSNSPSKSKNKKK
ncbi:MAG: hypothetical protein SFU86_02460 [Pirellulaceae bacterium]|nr:hypothetical protein [Pirellulaceae bacterium]